MVVKHWVTASVSLIWFIGPPSNAAGTVRLGRRFSSPFPFDGVVRHLFEPGFALRGPYFVFEPAILCMLRTASTRTGKILPTKMLDRVS
jgi:hypothetical protein